MKKQMKMEYTTPLIFWVDFNLEKDLLLASPSASTTDGEENIGETEDDWFNN